MGGWTSSNPGLGGHCLSMSPSRSRLGVPVCAPRDPVLILLSSTGDNLFHFPALSLADRHLDGPNHCSANGRIKRMQYKAGQATLLPNYSFSFMQTMGVFMYLENWVS